MNPKKIPVTAVWAVSAAVILVVVLLAAFFLGHQTPKEEDAILLPAPPTAGSDTLPEEEALPEAPDETFVALNNDNVVMALQTLHRPAAYHQTYDVSVGVDDAMTLKKVSLWVNGDLLQAEVSDEQQVRTLITDGTTAYMWYNGDEAYISVTLQDHMHVEDLLGLPDFDSYLELRPESVVDSGYLYLEDPQMQCIYVCLQSAENTTVRHWVNLENGLLYQSDVLENSDQVYKIRQTQFEALAVEDETFADCFLLPDGTFPFTAKTRIQQP